MVKEIMMPLSPQEKYVLMLRIALYPAMALLSLGFMLFSMLLVYPWLPLFANAQGEVPRYLKWFVTFDASLDEGWKGGYLHPRWGQSGFMRYLARLYWLYRNPGYGFDYDVLGLPFDQKQWRVLRTIESPTLVLFIALGPAFNIYAHGRFGMLKLGWKAWNQWDGTQWKRTPWSKVPLCCSWSPFKRRI
jgi:hypothetical protein